jgi:hypothetical protein
MATYKTEKDCFIGSALRKAGTTFSVDKEIADLPEWLTPMNLTPQQKAAATKSRNDAIKQKAKDENDVAIESNRAANSKVEEL